MVGLSALRAVRTQPFAGGLAIAEAKLLAAVPHGLRETLTDLPRIVGFERAAPSAFHLRPSDRHEMDTAAAREQERDAIDAFLGRSCAEDGRDLLLVARTPRDPNLRGVPVGISRIAIAGICSAIETKTTPTADMARRPRAGNPVHGRCAAARAPFDVRGFLDRAWLTTAIASWSGTHPVRIVMTARAGGSPPTRLVLPARHLHAGGRWPRDDDLRPITPGYRRRVAALARAGGRTDRAGRVDVPH